MQFKRKFRILPIFIFTAVLMLSIRITHIVDNIQESTKTQIEFGAQDAVAEETENNKETAKLNQILDQSTSGTPSSIDSKNSFSQSEIAILQDLAKRREELDLKDKEIDKKALQLKITEEEIQKKLEQLQAYEERLRKLMQEYSDKEKEKVMTLVKLYTSMKPKDAARIFNTLDIELSTALLKEMKPSASSAILSQMDAQKARAVTNQLIGNSLNNIE